MLASILWMGMMFTSFTYSSLVVQRSLELRGNELVDRWRLGHRNEHESFVVVEAPKDAIKLRGDNSQR